MVSKKIMIITGFIGGVAHLVGSAADLFSGYSLQGNTLISSSFSLLNPVILEQLLATKSVQEFVIGHYLAIFGIPLGMVGLWHVYHLLKPGLLSKLFFIMGIYAYVLGTVFHSTFGFLGIGIKTTSINSFSPLFSLLAIVFPTIMVILLLLLFILMYRGKSFYPNWMLGFHPLVIQLVTGLVAFVLPAGFKILLIVTAYNLSMTVYYLASTYFVWKNYGNVLKTIDK